MDSSLMSVDMLNYTTANPGGSAALPAVHQVNVFYAIFYPTLIIVTSIMNLATIGAFWKLRSLREKPSELFILNLACADLLTGMVLLPFGSFLYITPGYWPTGETGCIVTVALFNLSIHGSLFGLTTISVDRFLLVYMEYPQYIKKVTRAKVYKVIATGWVFVVVTIVIELSLWNVAKDIDESARNIPFDFVCLSPARRVRAFSLTFFLILYFCPVTIVCIMSAAFLYQLRKRLQKNSSRRKQTIRQGTSSTSGPGETTMTSQIELKSTSTGDDLDEKSGHKTKTKNKSTGSHLDRVTRNRYVKPGITLIGLVVAMASCMLPYCFYVLITESGCERCNNTKVLFGLLVLQFCNACLDPFIYVLTRRKVRQFYKSIFLKIKCCTCTN